MGLVKKDRDRAVAERERGVAWAMRNGMKDLARAHVWFSKYLLLRNNAKRRKTECFLTFPQYIRLARKAGITNASQIGNQSGKYQMGRLGDSGPYEVGNCRFITLEQNRAEQFENGGNQMGALSRLGYSKHTRPAIARMAKEYRGRTKEDYEHIARAADTRSKDFRVKSPNGKVFKGRNLKEFCSEHGLHQGCMHMVCAGIRVHHRQWTGTYTRGTS